MTRREILTAAGSAAIMAAMPQLAPAQTIPNPLGSRGMGGAAAGFGAHNGAGAGRGGGRGAGAAPGTPTAPAGPRPYRAPDEFIDYCHSLGLGGVEVGGGPPLDPDEIHKLKDKIQSYNMHLIFNVPLPQTESDIERFDASVKAAAEIGAYGLHAAMTARRYEQLKTLADFRKNFENNQRQIALAEPTLRKNKMRLAIENHKGWRAVEQAEWMKRVNSPYVGVHFDFGNNVSLCEDPMFTLETLKPWVFSCHIKDMAVKTYDEGFLLSEVPFGDGFLDLKKMVDTLRAKDPDMPIDLEMITRDPLKIPIYTEQYWATFPDLPGQQMAHMMEIIEKNPPKKPLPTTTGMSPEERKKSEEINNIACIRYARERLSL